MKSYTDLEQSKKLSDILPLESADMWYWEFPTAPTYNGYGYPMFHKGEDIRNVPCWSLAALIELITKIQQGGIFYNLTYDFILNKWTMNIEADNWTEDIGLYDNPVDACYEMILKLHELKML